MELLLGDIITTCFRNNRNYLYRVYLLKATGLNAKYIQENIKKSTYQKHFNTDFFLHGRAGLHGDYSILSVVLY